MGRLNAGDWARAALEALAEGGLAAVAVEPVAVRLGTTKGSFYWHFANRKALIEAALALWEARTEEIITELLEIADPAARMRTLLEGAFDDTADAAVAFQLVSAADDPLAAEVARRVSTRRLEFMQAILEELGQPAELARRRVVAGYGVYLGMAALRRVGAVDESFGHSAEMALAEMGVSTG
ncbi:TetR/AcrR family transcriptional regulator [Streptosporangium sp. NPDC000396]|uniref:TetR/AcrR family transcriptional regulator n=1 Tax=Streptosporangium sp. NPDC000396 TaxID=3366185 RepID=UPI00369768F5